MGVLTRQRGPSVIARMGGFEKAMYGLKEGHGYPTATEYIAETYRQLKEGPTWCEEGMRPWG